MKRDDYVKKLEKMYEEYYTGKDGYCRFFDECKEDNSPCKFASDKAKVGIEYGNDDRSPKIVFVGLEGLHSNTKEKVIPCVNTPSLYEPNSHYRGVMYVQAYLLSDFINKEKPHNTLSKTLKSYDDITKYMTLLNCYKCAFTQKSQGLPHTDSMKKNCQEILFREIEILEPDIVVIQVKKDLPKNFANEINKRFGNESSGVSLSVGNDDKYTRAYRYNLSGKPLVLIWTYHGSGDPDPQKRAWVNDNKNGNVYINKELNPVLDRAIEEYKMTRKY